MSVFVTGDCHGNFSRFNKTYFYQQKGLTRDDIVIICGDFGLWFDTKEERKDLDYLNEKPWTTVWCDGNHENYDRLYSDEFPVIDFHGGKAHKIRDNVYHLMRGYVFDFDGKKFFVMGGASSHDISDGIIDEKDFDSYGDFIRKCEEMNLERKMFRINHYSWWKEELPSKIELERGKQNLEKVGNKVDFVISHCLPTMIERECGFKENDSLNDYFQELVQNGLEFTRWYAGHYHIEKSIFGKYIIHYYKIEQIA